MTATYTVLDGNGPTLWAGRDRNAALAWAQAHADALALKRPGQATPHLVVQVWHEGQTRWQDDLHVYAERPTPKVAS